MCNKTKAVYRYNLQTVSKPVGIFYLVVFLILLFFSLTAFLTSGSSQVTGIEFSTIIFLFVLALVDFRENFEVLNQFGTSRKSIYFGKVLSFSTLGLVITLIDRLVAFLVPTVTKFIDNFMYESFFNVMYEHKFQDMEALPKALLPLLLAFSMYMAALSAGTFLSVLFYRTNRIGRIAIAAGIPIFIFVALPIIMTYIYTTKLSKVFMNLLELTLSTPLRASITFLSGALLIGTITYFVVKKATLKGK